MNKKIIVVIVVILVVAIAVAGYLFLSSKNSTEIDWQHQPNYKITNQGVLPSIGEGIDPLQNKPNMNPVDVSNPFRSVKTNPFE